MSLVPVKNLKEYKILQDSLKERFRSERTGDQDLFREQTKVFLPLIEKQEEVSKSLSDKIVAGQDITSNAIVPFARELQRRNDLVSEYQQRDAILQDYNQLPFNQSEIEQSFEESTPKKRNRSDEDLYNFDNKLNEADEVILRGFNFDLPSKVYKENKLKDALKKITKEKKAITNTKKTTSDERRKETFDSQYNTLDKYRLILKDLEIGEKYRVKKTGDGLKPDIIPYNNVNDLLEKLSLFYAENQAGHTGVDNYIVSILDELLRINAIDKKTYNKLNKKILHY